MHFLFVDETGDPGAEPGTSEFFGYSVLSTATSDYHALNLLMAQVCWLCGNAKPMRWTEKPYRVLNLLRGLKEYADNDLILASASYVQKAKYGGCYLRWANYGVPEEHWPYYLRNYVLRHALEFHFCDESNLQNPLELIIDRVVLREEQRENTSNYLNSVTRIPLRERFKIPRIMHLTLADSHYVQGLQIAHVLADILRLHIKSEATPMVLGLSSFMRIQCLLGHKQEEAQLVEGSSPPHRS